MSNVWSSGRQKFWLWAGAALLLVSMLIGLGARSAFAGNASINDETGVLSSSDKSELQSRISSLPYNVRIVVTNNVNSSNFQSRVQSESSSLGTGLVLVVSPAQRLTGVESKNIGITASEATDIRSTANSAFASSNWRGGLDNMLDRSRSLASAGSSGTATRPTSSSSGGGFPFFGCLVIGIIALVAISFFGFGRRRTINNTMMGGGPNYGPGYNQGYGPGYNQGYGPGYNQGYGPGYGNQGGIGPLGGGAIGAGLGGLIGYELGKDAGRHEAGYNNNPGYSGGGFGDDSGASVGGWGNDSGGSSGGWGNDSGGSSGGDWGSSGSFGGGGGGDWGGGGGDSGGGGGGDSSGSW